MKKLSLVLTLLASPAMAASGPFFSLQNTNFVVLIAFIVFVGILVYMKVPAKLTGMLDARAATIKAELDEARALREEAKSILATYERRQKEVQEQADRIVAQAKDEAMAAAAQAKEDLKASIARRLAWQPNRSPRRKPTQSARSASRPSRWPWPLRAMCCRSR